MGAASTSQTWTDLARAKLVGVLGESTAQRVLRETLAQLRLTELTSADDLYRFGRALSDREGFAGAVGGMLSVTAVMRGGKPSDQGNT